MLKKYASTLDNSGTKLFGDDFQPTTPNRCGHDNSSTHHEDSVTIINQQLQKDVDRLTQQHTEENSTETKLQDSSEKASREVSSQPRARQRFETFGGSPCSHRDV
jgi:hypothetical protein